MAKLDSESDRRFEGLARVLRPARRTYRERLQEALALGYSGREAIRVAKEADEFEDTSFLRVFEPGPGLMLDYELGFHAPFVDKGDGQVDIRNVSTGVDGTFTRATVASCRLSSGLLKKVASGVPRSHYLEGGTYGGYLAEGQRTNLCLRSEELDNASWTKTRSTATADAVAAPDGTTTADKLVEDATAANTHFVSQAVTGTADANYAISFFLKAGERTWARITGSNGANVFGKYYNLTTGALGSDVTAGTGAVVTSSIESWGNGWYRCTVVGSVGSGATAITVALNLAEGDTDITFSGDGASGLYVWGAQFENNASFASSYIPTTSTSATRNADQLVYPNSGNIRDVEGTAYAELTLVASEAVSSQMALVTEDLSGRLLWVPATGPTELRCYDGSNTAGQTGLTTMVGSTPRKRASSWGPAGLRATGDGASPATGTFDGNMGAAATSNLGVGFDPNGSNQWQGTLKNVQIFKRQMPDAALQAMTA